ncbi:MAG TPA: PadR family transcriptional regulator [Pseudonocardiaceae bacterium]|nr:PadR family transcriptional regulator [Pseudonocardiaceae bacterium]
MAQRRKVGNLLALAMLSALIQRPMHPYEMASVLRSQGKDKDMPIKWGSLYTVVANLEKHGFIEAVESVRQGGRPERTVYRITAAGRVEVHDWVGELLATPDQEPRQFTRALSVLAVLSPDDAIELLGTRLKRLEQDIAEARDSLTHAAREVPRLFLIEDEYELAISEAEANWVRALLEELRTGALPGVDAWRAYHETGEVSAYLVELTERGISED